jgi:hypothetical protein
LNRWFIERTEVELDLEMNKEVDLLKDLDSIEPLMKTGDILLFSHEGLSAAIIRLVTTRYFLSHVAADGEAVYLIDSLPLQSVNILMLPCWSRPRMPVLESTAPIKWFYLIPLRTMEKRRTSSMTFPTAAFIVLH